VDNALLEKPRSAISYFYSFFLFLAVATVAEFLYAGAMGVFQGTVLSVMELSLSFDNAVINALILQTMTLRWRRAFITWGMLFAVFGMRLVFPVLIVSVTTGMSFADAFNLAITNPTLYESYIFENYAKIMAFGSIFLLMIFVEFLLNSEKEIHWIAIVERNAAKWASVDGLKIFFVVLFGLMVTHFLPQSREIHGHLVVFEKYDILISMLFGLLSFMMIGFIKNYLEGNDVHEPKDREEIAHSVSGDLALKGGLASFLYLEMIDMSLSFDGVLAAFAVSQNIIIIMLGLGVGAMAVRSLTLLMVDKKTVYEFVYLEHGAMWSIGLLAFLMSIQLFVEVPEVLVAILAILPISVAFFHSKRIAH
jgi:hypothetical protein